MNGKNGSNGSGSDAIRLKHPGVGYYAGKEKRFKAVKWPKKNKWIEPEDDPLDEDEMEAADEIAEEIDTIDSDERGLYIWKVCDRYGVDHHRVARHLGQRRRSK